MLEWKQLVIHREQCGVRWKCLAECVKLPFIWTLLLISEYLCVFPASNFGYLPGWELLNFLVPLLSGSWEWLAAFNIQICSSDNSLHSPLLIKYLVLTLCSSEFHFYLVLCRMRWVKRWGRIPFRREVKGNLIEHLRGLEPWRIKSNTENKTDLNCKMWNMKYIRPESSCQCRRWGRCEFDRWVGKMPWRRKWQPIPVFLYEESHGQKRLAGYSPWGLKRVGHDLATKQQFDFIM